MILERNKLDTCHVLPTCYRTQIPLMLLFNLHRALENFAGENFFKTLLDPVPGENVFFDYFVKLQMKKKTNCLSWGPNKKFKNVFNLKFSTTQFFL